MSSQLESRQQEVLSLQKSLTASQQEKETLEKELGCVVSFLLEYVICDHFPGHLKDKLRNYITPYCKYLE